MQVLSSDRTNQSLMVEQVLQWFEGHPQGFEQTHRSMMLTLNPKP